MGEAFIVVDTKREGGGRVKEERREGEREKERERERERERDFE
jgi:hypothetical protein